MSWLPLGSTGLSPLTVNAAAAVGRAVAVAVAVAEVSVGDGVRLTDGVSVTGGGPVAAGVAEHPTKSVAIAHRAATATAVRAIGAI